MRRDKWRRPAADTRFSYSISAEMRAHIEEFIMACADKWNIFGENPQPDLRERAVWVGHVGRPRHYVSG